MMNLIELFFIALWGGFYGFVFYTAFCSRDERSDLEKQVRAEESGLKRSGFRQIAGGYYIRTGGAGRIYTRREALRTMEAEKKSEKR